MNRAVHRTEAIAAGLAYLREKDPILAAVIDRAGPFEVELEADPLVALVRSIISQQISGGAARSIYDRLTRAAGGERKFGPALARFSPEDFRQCGVSAQKARYLRDLAEKVQAGTVRIRQLDRLANDEVMAEVMQVNGIGPWTAQMLLIFCLGRLDVFPGGDLGVRNAIRRLYGLRREPSARQLARYERLWQPYASMASWYCWRSLEFKD